MSISNISTLTQGAINGLNSLYLDELNTTSLNSNTIDTDQIYYKKIEGNEIIVDQKLILTSTGVISVGNKNISDIELTYLDGVSSNIQTQINNINQDNVDLENTVNTHTNQITALQNYDTTNTTNITTLQSKTQNITSATTTSTNTNRPFYIKRNAECIRMIGDHTFIT